MTGVQRRLTNASLLVCLGVAVLEVPLLVLNGWHPSDLLMTAILILWPLFPLVVFAAGAWYFRRAVFDAAAWLAIIVLVAGFGLAEFAVNYYVYKIERPPEIQRRPGASFSALVLGLPAAQLFGAWVATAVVHGGRFFVWKVIIPLVRILGG